MKKIGVVLAAVLLVAVGAAYVAFFRTGPVAEACAPVPGWTLKTDGPGLNRPMDVAWGAGFLHVADGENGSIKRYREDGSLVDSRDGFHRPVATAPAGDAVYVADFLADEVVKLNREGAVLVRWGRTGDGPGEFDAPAGVAVDRDGQVYVSDFYNHRIQVFDPAGRFLREWGRRGIRSGRFRFPAGIVVSEEGEVYVADVFNHRVQVFTREGEYVRKWGGTGYGLGGGWAGWFAVAKEVALSPQGDVYVADAFNRRVQKFTADGRLRAVWYPEADGTPVRYPAGVAVGPDGDVYVSDFFENRIWRLRCGPT